MRPTLDIMRNARNRPVFFNRGTEALISNNIDASPCRFCNCVASRYLEMIAIDGSSTEVSAPAWIPTEVNEPTITNVAKFLSFKAISLASSHSAIVVPIYQIGSPGLLYSPSCS